VTPAWLKFMPSAFRARVEHRPNLQKALINTAWLLGDKLLRMGAGLFVGVWMARYLGPEEFGLLNYAMAIVALFGAVAGLGLGGIVVRDLVQKPDGTYVTLGTAFLLQFVGGGVAFSLAVAAVSILRPVDDLARMMVAILGFALVLKSSEAVKYWFESQVTSKYAVWAENGVFLVLTAVRIVLILSKAPLIAFVWAAFAETALIWVALLLTYEKKVGGLTRWSANFSRARSLIMESWPLILGAIASMVNMRMDQVMLGSMVNNLVVGNYSAAMRLAEVWLIVPGIIASSIYPSIIAAKEAGEDLYRRRVRKITKLMALWVVPTALAVSMLSELIVSLVYGVQYADAGSYLAISIWTGVPYLVFFALNQVLYIERLLKVAFGISIFTVASNVLLNLALIPLFGGIGAAVSTLITSIATAVISLIIINSKTGIFKS